MLTDEDIRKAKYDAANLITKILVLKCGGNSFQASRGKEILHNIRYRIRGGKDVFSTVQNYLTAKRLIGKKVPRIQELQKLIGKYTTDTPEILKMYPQNTAKSLKTLGLSDTEISRLIQQKSVDFVVSTRYTDILRCSETEHFSSCLRFPSGCNCHAANKYCRIPRIGIVYVEAPDKTFMARRFIWANKDGTFSWWRKYGNAPWDEIQKTLETKKNIKFREFNHEQNENYLKGGVYYDAGI